MNMLALQTDYPASNNRWDLEDIYTALFKCTRWQVEATMDPLNCPYHYFCDSTYPGDYPPIVDILLMLFTTTSYMATLILLGMELCKGIQQTCLTRLRRYLLPSGPISLPIFVLALAKDQRINTIFPLNSIGPAILQLIQISALAFDHESDKDIKYALFEASMISGILHASLYLDSIILPYYTGFDALVTSTFSGECITCMCRKEIMVAGGKLISYRGLSHTTYLITATLCLRIFSRLPADNKDITRLIKSLLENLGWILIATDCVYVVNKSPPERTTSRIVASTGLLVLICLHVLRKVCTKIGKWHSESLIDINLCK